MTYCHKCRTSDHHYSEHLVGIEQLKEEILNEALK